MFLSQKGPKKDLKTPIDLKLEAIVKRSPRFHCKLPVINRIKKIANDNIPLYNRLVFQHKFNKLRTVYRAAWRDYMENEYEPKELKGLTLIHVHNSVMHTVERYATLYEDYNPNPDHNITSAGSSKYLPRVDKLYTKIKAYFSK